MKKAYGNEIDPKCAYCCYGTTAADKTVILCPKKGIMNQDDRCKKYRYNPLKRVPRRAEPMTGFSQEDFEL